MFPVAPGWLKSTFFPLSEMFHLMKLLDLDQSYLLCLSLFEELALDKLIKDKFSR